MKKAEFSFSPLVYAILALIILVVAIAVYFGLSKGPLAGIFGIVNKTGDQGNDAIDDLTISIGRCESGDERCVAGKEYVCDRNNRWVNTENDC